MKKTGELLKKAREAKGLSLHEIGLSLKISSKILKAIEEGDDAHLPAKTFLRGFVQSYANFLHLDSEKILEVFYEEMGSTRPKPYIRAADSDKGQAPESESSESAIVSPAVEATVTPLRKASVATEKSSNLQALQKNDNRKTVIITVIGLALVGLILFTKKMIDKYSKEAEVPTAEVAQTIEGVTPVATEIVPTQVTSPNASSTPIEPTAAVTTPLVTPTATPAVVPSPTPVQTPTPAPSPTPASTVSPTPATTPIATPTPKPTVAPTPTPTPIATPTPTPTPKELNKPVELIVEALDAVEIEYSAPNGKPQKIKLSAEQVHTFKSKSGLKINLSNGGAVNLILNGKELGIPGDLGKPIKLSY